MNNSITPSQVRVLVVEDDSNTASCLCDMLKTLGMQNVVRTADGLEALKYLNENPEFNGIIVSDWNMPHKSGLELLREIRQVSPEMPFLMITARADENSVVTALDAGVTSYIRKPFTLDELEHKIVSLVSLVPSSD